MTTIQPRGRNNVERIKRPPNAFMLFCMEKRREVAELFPQYKNNEITKILGVEWDILHPDDKEIYEAAAREKADEHRRNYPDYIYDPNKARVERAQRRQAQTDAQRTRHVGRRPTAPQQLPSAQQQDVQETTGTEGLMPIKVLQSKAAEAQDHLDEVIEELVVIDAANDESRPSTPEPLTPSPKPVAERKFISPKKWRPEIPSAKKKKALQVDKEIKFMTEALGKPDDLTTQATANKDDAYDHFGRYVASMLRTIGPPDAMMLQQQITIMLTNKMAGPSHQSYDNVLRLTTSCSGNSGDLYAPSYDEEYTWLTNL